MAVALAGTLAEAAERVDLTRANYALRLAPQYRKGERPGSIPTPCVVDAQIAASLSRAQDVLRLRELYLRIQECADESVTVVLEDRSGTAPRNGPRELKTALEAQGLKLDTSHPNRFLR